MSTIPNAAPSTAAAISRLSLVVSSYWIVISEFVPRVIALLSTIDMPKAKGTTAVVVCVPSFKIVVVRPVAKPSSS